MIVKNRRNSNIASAVLAIFLLGLSLSGCGYTKQQVEKEKELSYQRGVSAGIEMSAQKIRELERKNETLQRENNSLKEQQEQTLVELQKERSRAARYWQFLLIVAGTSFVGIASTIVYYTIRKLRRQKTPKESFDFGTRTPPSVTQEI